LSRVGEEFRAFSVHLFLVDLERTPDLFLEPPPLQMLRVGFRGRPMLSSLIFQRCFMPGDASCPALSTGFQASRAVWRDNLVVALSSGPDASSFILSDFFLVLPMSSFWRQFLTWSGPRELLGLSLFSFVPDDHRDCSVHLPGVVGRSRLFFFFFGLFFFSPHLGCSNPLFAVPALSSVEFVPFVVEARFPRGMPTFFSQLQKSGGRTHPPSSSDSYACVLQAVATGSLFSGLAHWSISLHISLSRRTFLASTFVRLILANFHRDMDDLAATKAVFLCTLAPAAGRFPLRGPSAPSSWIYPKEKPPSLSGSSSVAAFLRLLNFCNVDAAPPRCMGCIPFPRSACAW